MIAMKAKKPTGGLLMVDVGAYYRSGDAIRLDTEPDGGYVLVTIDTEDEEKDLMLTPPQARALAAALDHLAGEIEHGR